MNKDNFLQQFQLNPTVGYHPESVERVSHITEDQLRKAAVVVGLVEREDGLHVIFTKRAAHLKHHPGQVSFPGGKHELSDPSMQFTALRELHEEVGIRSDQVKHRVFAMPFEEHLIWGVTAQIIQSLQRHVVQQIT